MIDKVVELLQQECPQLCWARDGDERLPNAPYGVVRGEKAPTGRGVRVTLHRNKGEQNQLEDDLRSVITILSNRELVSRNGNHNQLGGLIDYSDVAPVSDDGTISMEAYFVMPTKSF